MSSFMRLDRLGKDAIEILPRSRFPDAEINELLKEAAKDPYLGEFIYKKKLSDIVLFAYEGELAGFAIPRKDSDGRYRTGPIFVRHGMRRKGIAKKFVLAFFDGKRGRSWIEETNKASQRLYESSGFRKTDKTYRDGDEVLYEYLKD